MLVRIVCFRVWVCICVCFRVFSVFVVGCRLFASDAFLVTDCGHWILGLSFTDLWLGVVCVVGL